MREYDFIYAVRNINTREIVNKRKGNPFFISRYQAEQLKEIKEKEYWNKNNEKYEVVCFKLQEISQLQ